MALRRNFVTKGKARTIKEDAHTFRARSAIVLIGEGHHQFDGAGLNGFRIARAGHRHIQMLNSPGHQRPATSFPQIGIGMRTDCTVKCRRDQYRQIWTSNEAENAAGNAKPESLVSSCRHFTCHDLRFVSNNDLEGRLRARRIVWTRDGSSLQVKAAGPASVPDHGCGGGGGGGGWGKWGGGGGGARRLHPDSITAETTNKIVAPGLRRTSVRRSNTPRPRRKENNQVAIRKTPAAGLQRL